MLGPERGSSGLDYGDLISPTLPPGIPFRRLSPRVCDKILNDLKQKIDSKINEIELKKIEIEDLQEQIDDFLPLCD